MKRLLMKLMNDWLNIVILFSFVLQMYLGICEQLLLSRVAGRTVSSFPRCLLVRVVE